MAGYYRTKMQELDDVYRLLPQEILEDIGIIDPAEQRLLDVVEDLAVRLAGLLGGAAKITHCHHTKVNVARGLGGRDVPAAGGNVRSVAAAPFFPAPAVPWQLMERLRNNKVLHPSAAMPIFPSARPLASGALPTTVQRNSGTGVFLPRTDAVRRAAKAARWPRNGSGKHRHGEQAAMAIRKQQEMEAMAAQMEQRYLDVHARPELALPQEWTY